MGTLAAYALSGALYLVLAWGVWKLAIGMKIPLGFNRIIILIIYATALVAPVIAGFFGYIGKSDAAGAIQIPLDGINAQLAHNASTFPLYTYIIYVYMAGFVATLVYTLVGLLKISLIIARGKHIGRGRDTIVLCNDSYISPFSFGRWIVMNENDYANDSGMIILHESAHISRRHWLDLLLAQAVCCLQWFNPVAWMMRRSLRLIHEYQADSVVLAAGVRVTDYQFTLLRCALGRQSSALTHSFTHTTNLKKRIIMMNSKNFKCVSRLRSLALVPAIAVAFGISHIPAVASVISATSDASTSASVSVPPSTPEASQAGGSEQSNVEKMAEFPGGINALFKWMADNMRFPESMEKAGIEGRVVASFTINKDGSISDIKIVRSLCPAADEELIRMINAMPRWTPAEIDGKPVAVTYTLPCQFKLAPAKKQAK